MLALVVLSPLLLVVALSVALTSRGPVLFRQPRVGRDGRTFTFYKFRSMRVLEGGLPLTAAGDARITPIGKVLRKLKLDELPELWNVVRGDMALVGPRPEVPRYVDLDDPLWQEVLAVRPGLTDPVTLRLRNEEELLGALDGDPDTFYRSYLLPFKLRGYRGYLRQRSAWSDLLVLWDTLLGVLLPGRNPPPASQEIALLWGETESGAVELPVRRSWSQVLVPQLQFGLDLLVLAGAFVLAYLLRFDFNLPHTEWENVARQLPYVMLLQLGLSLAFGIPSFVWRYISLAEVQAFVKAGALSAAVLLAVWWLLPANLQPWRVPRSVILLDALLAAGGLLAVRVMRRMQYERQQRQRRQATAPAAELGSQAVLLVGAGQAGILAAREIRRHHPHLEIKGFIDDDRGKRGAVIQGIRVLGSSRELPRLVPALGIERVIVTIAEASPLALSRILEICQKIPVPARIMPGLFTMLDGGAQDLGLEELSMPGLEEPL